jgi:HSP20 family protein
MWLQRDFVNDLGELRNLVGNFIREREGEYRANPLPVNVYEDKDKLYAVMPMAGISKESVEIHYENSALNIKTKKEIEAKDISRVLRRERKTGEYQRVIKINTAINPASIEAKYENGFLIVGMDKKEEAKCKKIKIQ